MIRLIMAIVSTLVEEAALVAVVMLGLPALGVHLPLLALFVLMVGWAAVSVLTYRLGSRALKRKLVARLPSLVGCEGQAVTPVAEEGMVKIKGELWCAHSVSGMIKPGEVVEVVGQENMKLMVRPRTVKSSAETK